MRIIIKFMRIVLGANLAEGKCMFSQLLDMNIILLKKKMISYSVEVNRRVRLKFFGS